MSVIIRLQNLPWSANAADIRNFFRGLSIPEGGVHIVGGEQGDAFIAFSTDEDARQGMMLDGGKIKEVQVKLLLSSRSEMHKVIEAARQGVSLLQLQQNIVTPAAPVSNFMNAEPRSQVQNLGYGLHSGLAAIPGFGSLTGIPGANEPPPQPAVIEPPMIEPEPIVDVKSSKRRSGSRSRSTEKERKDRGKDKRDRRDKSRSRSRDRRRRERSRSRDRRDRSKRDRKDRSRSRERNRERERESDREREKRRSRDNTRRQETPPGTNGNNQQAAATAPNQWMPAAPFNPNIPNQNALPSLMQQQFQNNGQNNLPYQNIPPAAVNDDVASRIRDLQSKRNPNAFQSGNPTEASAGLNFPNHSNKDSDTRNDAYSTRGKADTCANTCIQIRNIPLNAGYGDVRRFLLGTNIHPTNNIKMLHDNEGCRVGIAYVRFTNESGKKKALTLSGGEIRGQSVMVTHLDDSVYEKTQDGERIDFGKDDTRNNFENDNKQSQDSVIMLDSVDKKMDTNILKFSDLPNFTNEQDIMKKLSTYTLLCVTVVDSPKTKSKTAYVQFSSNEEAKSALENHINYYIGRKHILITKCMKSEYDEVVKTLNSSFGKKKPDIVDLTESNTSRDPRQRRETNTGPEAAVMPPMPFPDIPFPMAPFNQMPVAFPNGPKFGPPFPTPTDPLAPVWGSATGPPPIDQSLDCVLIKGLPLKASDRTILDFFSDVGVVPTRIHLMLDRDGVPSGECFCEFRTPADAHRAATKNLSPLGNGVVGVELVSRRVVEEALDGPKIDEMHPLPPIMNLGFEEPNMRDDNFGGNGFSRSVRDNFAPRNRDDFSGRGHSEFNSRSRGGFNSRGRGEFSSRGRGDFNSRGRGDFNSRGRGDFNNRGRSDFPARGRGDFNSRSRDFSPRGRDDFKSRPPREDFNPRGQNDFNGRNDFRGLPPRGDFNDNLSKSGGFMPRGGRGGRGGSRGRAEDNIPSLFNNEKNFEESFIGALPMPQAEIPGPDGFGKPGCVLAMENVPFKATVDDIMDFFHDFNITPDDILRRFNERGQPTADARVSFMNPSDAQAALNRLNRGLIFGRPVYLSLV